MKISLIELIIIITMLLIVALYFALPAILIANYGDLPISEVPSWVIWVMRLLK
jgi:hypothetical protein